MDPMTIMVGASLVSGLAQAYTSAKARDASQAELDAIKAKFDSIAPPEYNLKITDPPKLITQKIQAPKYGAELQQPNWNLAAFKPEDMKLVGKYAPEAAQKITEANPTLITKSADMQTGRAAQLAALQRFKQIGEGGYDPEFQQAVQTARMGAQAEAQSRQNSILQDFARRGQSGSGLSLAAQLGGASQAMNTNAMQGMDAATQAYRNRLQALSQGAQLGGQISSEDQNLQANNANIINAFNQRMSANEQAYLNNRADLANQAQQYNLQNAQSLANQNVQARNQASLADRSRLDDIMRANLNLAQSNQSRQDQLANLAYERAASDRDYTNNAALQTANWNRQNVRDQNEMKSKQYQDLLGKAQAASGLSQQQNALTMQGAQDRNALIGGVGNVAMTYGMGQQAAADKKADREWQEKMYKDYGKKPGGIT